MALTITEFQELGKPEPGQAQIAQFPHLATNSLAISGTSALSAAFNASTRFIRVATDSSGPVCVVVDFNNPTATTADARMPSDSVEYFGVKPGMKLAGISTT